MDNLPEILLINGSKEPTGEGAVKFRPDGDFVIMTITYGGSEAEFAFLTTDVDAIIEIAQTMMPQGSESESVNWDAELQGILDGDAK